MPYEKQSIIIQNINKTFLSSSGEIAALQHINLSIGQGEFFCIVGPSGCGKTTLLRILAGLESASSGKVEMNVLQQNRPLNSMVFQEQSVFPWLTVEENVAYGLKMRGIAKKLRKEIAQHYIHMISLLFLQCFIYYIL